MLIKKDEKITTNFEPFNDEDIINKTYLDTKLSKIEDLLLLLEKKFNELKLRYDQQPEDVLIEKTVKTSIQILYDKGLFDIYDKADEVLKDYLLIDEPKKRR